MKVILSRKGFDSKAGGIANPILPDGTLLSLPIPMSNDCNKYSDLIYNGDKIYGDKTFLEIIRELTSNPKFSDITCHLDPDIRKDVKKRSKNWKPLFGQQDIAQAILKKCNVKIGDIFLFFGWFKETHIVNGKLCFKKGTPDRHIIYGYLQIGKIHNDMTKLPDELKYHPHAIIENYDKKRNCIYEATKRLTFQKGIDGAGCFKFNESLVLTKTGRTRSFWALPKSFHPDNDVILSSHLPKNNNWSIEDNYSILKTVPQGQEFVFTADPNREVEKWCMNLIEENSK